MFTVKKVNFIKGIKVLIVSVFKYVPQITLQKCRFNIICYETLLNIFRGDLNNYYKLNRQLKRN